MKKEILTGTIASFLLILFYFVVMGLTSRSWSATISQFRQLWYWMIILAAGFGIQIGLYTHIKYQILNIKNTNQKSNISKNTDISVVGSSTASGVSMIACCAHHLTDVLPIIGLSGAAVFLTQYQVPLIILGVAVNGFGTIYMLKQIEYVKNK